MTLYYVVNARIPNTKAYALQVMRMQEALGRLAHVELIAPERFGVLRLYTGGRLLFFVGSLVFMLLTAAFFIAKRLRGKRFAIYTVDMDTFSGTLLPYLAPTWTEMHSPKKPSLHNRIFFARVRGVIATTMHTKEALMHTFDMPEHKVIVEPNGVDESALRSTLTKTQAREQLGLPLNEAFALYVGRLYAWKGLEVLPAAAALLDVMVRVVGGTKDEFEKVVGMSAGPLQFAGVRPAQEIPLWLAAADVLLVLGTARNKDSLYYTSPMKVFEYLAARRPIVASRTPALLSLIPEPLVAWYEPDNAASLVQALEAAQAPNPKHQEQGYALAAEHTWERRAQRIFAFMGLPDSLMI